MKRFAFVLSALLIGLQVSPLLGQASPGRALRQLKTLEGVWEGKDNHGRNVKVTYDTISQGKSVMATLAIQSESDMVTVYYVDGERLLLTHFCSAGNQPRLASPGLSEEGAVLPFKYLDATNLPSEADGHMGGLELDIKDDNNLTETWKWTKGGKESPLTISLTRKQ